MRSQALPRRVVAAIGVGARPHLHTGRPEPVPGSGASIGLDVTQPHMMWRTEVRGLPAGTKIFPNGTSTPRRNGAFVVSSVALAV